MDCGKIEFPPLKCKFRMLPLSPTALPTKYNCIYYTTAVNEGDVISFSRTCLKFDVLRKRRLSNFLKLRQSNFPKYVGLSPFSANLFIKLLSFN